jgi:putative PIN family toxin of toxin-antitoxin system
VGIPAQIVDAARQGVFNLVTSDAIITEVLRVLRYPQIQRKYRITDEQIEHVRTLLVKESVRTRLTVAVQGVATHPEDDPILATAVSAHADYLVTGDAQLLKLGTYDGVSIVSPRVFLDLIERGVFTDEGY